jgi:hypothetical protein
VVRELLILKKIKIDMHVLVLAHMQHIGWWSGEVGALHKPLSGEPSPVARSILVEFWMQCLRL